MDEGPGTWLEIKLGDDGIAGWLHDGDRPPELFSGWLELVALLETARARHGIETAPDASQFAP